MFAKKFPVLADSSHIKNIKLDKNIQSVSDTFEFGFENSGLMMNGTIHTTKVIPKEMITTPKLLKDIVLDKVEEKYFIKESDMHKWEYMKGGKAIERTSKEGFKYIFREGGIAFPDPLYKPARTMLTSEGSSNRSTHVIEDIITKRLRKLSPVECERINGFPDNWTTKFMTDSQTYFCMGNALVISVIKELADEIGLIVDNEF